MTIKKRKTTSLMLARQIAAVAGGVKALDIKILDLKKLTTFTDYFVIASGTSDRHVEAIVENIVLEMKKKGEKAVSVEGYGHSQWIIVDFADVVVHVFYPMMREVYAIEKLWGSAKVVRKRA